VHGDYHLGNVCRKDGRLILLTLAHGHWGSISPREAYYNDWLHWWFSIKPTRPSVATLLGGMLRPSAAPAGPALEVGGVQPGFSAGVSTAGGRPGSDPAHATGTGHARAPASASAQPPSTNRALAMAGPSAPDSPTGDSQRLHPVIPDTGGYDVLECGDLGSCGWNSVAAGYMMAKDRGRYPTRVLLQKTVARWLDEPAGRAMVEPHWVQKSEWTPRTEGGSIPQTYDEWVDTIRRPGRWICGFSLGAAAQVLQIRIYVFTESDEGIDIESIDGRSSSSDATIAVTMSEKHMVAIIPSRPWPAQWHQIARCVKMCDLRAEGRCGGPMRPFRGMCPWYRGQAFQQAAERCDGPERTEHHSNNPESGSDSTSLGSRQHRFLRCVCFPIGPDIPGIVLWYSRFCCLPCTTSHGIKHEDWCDPDRRRSIGAQSPSDDADIGSNRAAEAGGTGGSGSGSLSGMGSDGPMDRVPRGSRSRDRHPESRSNHSSHRQHGNSTSRQRRSRARSRSSQRSDRAGTDVHPRHRSSTGHTEGSSSSQRQPGSSSSRRRRSRPRSRSPRADRAGPDIHRHPRGTAGHTEGSSERTGGAVGPAPD
jgi:hypothetical protein